MPDDVAMCALTAARVVMAANGRGAAIAGPADPWIRRGALDDALKSAQAFLGLVDVPAAVGLRSAPGQLAQQVRVGIDSPAARLLGALATEEGVEVERCRGAAVFAGVEGLAQRPQLSFTVLEQSQRGAYDITGRPVAARGNLIPLGQLARTSLREMQQHEVPEVACVNATAVLYEGDPAPLAHAIAERLSTIVPLPTEDERAILPTQNTDQARAVANHRQRVFRRPPDLLRGPGNSARRILGGFPHAQQRVYPRLTLQACINPVLRRDGIPRSGIHAPPASYYAASVCAAVVITLTKIFDAKGVELLIDVGARDGRACE